MTMIELTVIFVWATAAWRVSRASERIPWLSIESESAAPSVGIQHEFRDREVQSRAKRFDSRSVRVAKGYGRYASNNTHGMPALRPRVWLRREKN